MSTTKNLRCPSGKIINPETGRCVKKSGEIGKRILSGNTTKKVSVRKRASPKKCPSGKIRNPTTGRCITPKKPKICADGKVINPKTGRCITPKTATKGPKKEIKAVQDVMDYLAKHGTEWTFECSQNPPKNWKCEWKFGRDGKFTTGAVSGAKTKSEAAKAALHTIQKLRTKT